MIYTVTLNPAIDKTIEVEQFKKGTLNKVCGFHTNIGGKGINVSLVLKVLGEENVALGLAGGKGGKKIREGLLKQGITSVFLETGSEIRINTKIVEKDGSLTELNGTGEEKVLKEVKAGYECGLVFEKFNDLQEMDIVEAYTMVEVPR